MPNIRGKGKEKGILKKGKREKEQKQEYEKRERKMQRAILAIRKIPNIICVFYALYG